MACRWFWYNGIEQAIIDSKYVVQFIISQHTHNKKFLGEAYLRQGQTSGL